MYCANSDYEKIAFKELPLGKIRIKINIPQLHLPTNKYDCSAIIAEESVGNLIYRHRSIDLFVVGRTRNARGSIKLPTKWEIEKLLSIESNV